MVAIRSLDDPRAQAASRVPGFTLAQSAPRAPSLENLAIPDTNGNGVYDVGDRPRAGVGPASPSTIAAALVDYLKTRPAKVVSLGEIHSLAADKRYRTIVEEANRQGLKPVAAIEASTNPAFKALTERLYAGTISPQDYVREGAKLLYADYETRGRSHPHQGGPSLYIGAFEHQLKNDVLTYCQMTPPVPVVFVDRERFSGRNREEGIAAEILAATRRYPNRTIFAQLGVIHGIETGRLKVTQEAREGKAGDSGVIEGYVDGDRPAMARVAAVLGRQAVLSVGLDQRDYSGLWFLSRPNGIAEIEAPPGSKPPFQNGMYDFIIRTKTRD